jgi:putative nucleotidyltransferase with HDIG domain
MWKLSEHTDWQLLEKEFDWVRDMKGVPQDAIFHAEGDVATHTQMVLYELEQLEEYRQLPEQEQHLLWAAALLHDVEKRSTTVIEADGSITSKGHAKKGAMTSRSILYRDMPTPFLTREHICGLVRFHGLPLWALEKEDSAKAVIEVSLQVNTQLLALLAKADVLGRTCNDQAELLYKVELFKELCIDNECWGNNRYFKTPNARFQYFKKDNGYADFVPFDEFGSHVIMMSGLPGAGKDTYVQTKYYEWPVVNLDDIRRENKISATDKSGNGKVIQIAKEKARVYLRQHTNFVWNATNVTKQMREQLIDLFIPYKAFVEIVYVEVPYRKLHVQNQNREAAIPPKIVEKLVSRLEVPVRSEAHEVVYSVKE